MHSSLKSLVSAAAAAAAMLSLIGGAAAEAASASGSTSGTVHVWVTSASGAVDKILLTGVIGDHGTATSINRNGTVNVNGEYVKVALQKGGFEVNAVAFNTQLQKLQPSLNAATCSAWATGSGPVTVSDGDGSLRRHQRHPHNVYELCRNWPSVRDRAEEGPVQHEQQRSTSGAVHGGHHGLGDPFLLSRSHP